MSSPVNFNLINPEHCYHRDDGTLCSKSFGSAVSVFSTYLSPQEKHFPNKNVGTFAAYCDADLPSHRRFTLQRARTIPIAHQHNPAVSYLEAY
jgi:hypothetical protein